MSIIIRLQNLPWSANSADIRRFFGGLEIPEGGVHIIGGDKGNAFIAFKNDEDARLAMQQDGNKVKDNRIKLFLSSRNEMQNLIDQVRKSSTVKGTTRSPERPVPREVRRSPERVPRRERSPERVPRKERSPERPPRRERSPERPTRRERSPLRNTRRSPIRRSARSRSKSPRRYRGRERSRDSDRFGRANRDGHSRPEHRSSPSKRLDSTSRSIHSYESRTERPDSLNYGDKFRPVKSPTDRELPTTTERVVDFRGLRHSPQRQDWQPEVKFVDSANLYDRRSPTAEYRHEPSTQIASLPEKSGEYDIFEKYIASKLTEGEFRSNLNVGSGFAGFPSKVEIAKNEFMVDRDNFSGYGAPHKETNISSDNFSRQDYSSPGMNSNHQRLDNITNFGFVDKNMPSDDWNMEKNIRHMPGFEEKNSLQGLNYFSDNKETERSFQGNNSVSHQFPSQNQGYGFSLGSPNDMQPFRTLHNTGVNRDVDVLRDGNRVMGFENQNTSGMPYDMQPNYCVQISGLGPNSSFRDVQSVLKGTFAPQHNIKWDLDDYGYKTGAVYVKLSNKEDFFNTLQRGTAYINGNPIEVRKCPDNIYMDRFPSTNVSRMTTPSSRFEQSKELCYMLKGLPYSAEDNDVINFFSGLNLVDLFILYDKSGKASGTAFVEFDNSADFHAAMERNGKKIGHRYIELMPAKRDDITDARKTLGVEDKPNVNLSSDVIRHTAENLFVKEQSGDKPFGASIKPLQRPPPKRPLCALLAGLPTNIRNSQISEFFGECGLKPNAIHIILSDNKRPNGKAFVEFFDLFDFDAALKRHGKCLGENTISVKQVLYEEMLNILDKHYAKHDFGDRVSNRFDSGSALEKVPYLWEPPDSTGDTESGYPSPKRRVEMERSDRFTDDNRHNFSISFRNSDSKYGMRDMHLDEGRMQPSFNRNEYGRGDGFQNEPSYMGKPSSFQSQQQNMNFPSQDKPTMYPNDPLYPDNERRYGMDNDFDRRVDDFSGYGDNPRHQPLQEDNFESSLRPNRRMDSFNEPLSDIKVGSYNQPQPNNRMNDYNQPQPNNRMDDYNQSQPNQRIDYNHQQPQSNNTRMDSYNQPQSNKKLDSYDKPQFSQNLGGFDSRMESFTGRRNEAHCIEMDISPHKMDVDPLPPPPFMAEEDLKIRAPVKFEVKIRQPVPTNPKVNDAFDRSSSKEEDKRKLRKLSPLKSESKNTSSTFSQKKTEKHESPAGDKKVTNFDSKTDSKTTSDTKNKPSEKGGTPSEAHKKLPRESKTDDTKKTHSGPSNTSTDNSKAQNNTKDDKEKPKIGDKKAETKKPEAKKPEEKKTEVKKVEDKKTEAKKPEEKKTEASSKEKEKPAPKPDVKEKAPKSSNSRAKDNFGHRRSSPNSRHFNPGYDFSNPMPNYYEGHDYPVSQFGMSEMDRYQQPYQSMPFGNSGCTVQASNVHPDIGLPQLLDFFRGFGLCSDDIIRRFSDYGEPTGDLRIAFHSPYDAERAMRILNHQHLRGIPISMFLV